MDYSVNDINALKEYATINNIPIMQDEGIDFLTTFIMKKQIKNIFNSIRLECKEFSVKNGIELKCRLGYTITQFNKRTALEYIDESIANMMLDHKYLEE